MRKILYISGARADYGLMRETLFAIKKHFKLEIEILAAGMHLMSEFGNTIKEIMGDGFKVHKINAVYEKDSKESMAEFVGETIQLLTREVKKIKPDIILLLGDRGEMLAGAVVGAYLTIPVAHIHGGDVSSTIDGIVRHALTKLSHIHFPATEKSAERIKKMGEESWRIFKVGAPGLDGILKEKLVSPAKIAGKYKLDLSKPVLLVLQHSVTAEIDNAEQQMGETMKAIKELGFQSIVIYPNADAGGRKIIRVIENYKKYPFIKIYKNIIHKDYLSLMNMADVLIGNSSSGIVEAASFGLPTVNIGTRQEDRERTCNVIDADYNKERIKWAVKKAIYDKKFRENAKNCKNPYGDGRTGKRIAEILSKIKIDGKLLNKQITY